jgi:hypothetical protein
MKTSSVAQGEVAVKTGRRRLVAMVLIGTMPLGLGACGIGGNTAAAAVNADIAAACPEATNVKVHSSGTINGFGDTNVRYALSYKGHRYSAGVSPHQNASGKWSSNKMNPPSSCLTWASSLAGYTS